MIYTILNPNQFKISDSINFWNTIKSKTLYEIKIKFLLVLAYRSVIKFWHKLNLFEMNKLLNESHLNDILQLVLTERPVIFEISLDELKKVWKIIKK